MGHRTCIFSSLTWLLGSYLLLAGGMLSSCNPGLEKREFRAIWLGWEMEKAAFTAQDKSNITTFLENQVEKKMNALVVQVPEQWDERVAFMVEECHKRNLEFHAWVQPVVKDGRGQHKMVEIITTLIRSYDLDGVLLSNDPAFFAESTTKKIGPQEMSWFLEELADSVYRIKPLLKLGLGPTRAFRDRADVGNLFSWSFSGTEAQMREWLEKGILDFLAPHPEQELSSPLSIGASLSQRFFKRPALIPSAPWKDQVKPFAPTTLWAAPSYDEVTLVWPLPRKAPDGERATYYVVYRFSGEEAPNTADPANIIGITRNRKFVDREVIPGKSYHYLVTAVDRLHNESREGCWVRVELPHEEIAMNNP